MQAIYLGVDVAGTTNTWMAALSADKDGLSFITQPRLSSLKDILAYCEEQNVVAVAIDAQLTLALSEDSGFRTSDLHLRRLLPPDCQNWVASINSLMAVPIRGRLLADTLSPVVGTILETHPRASLYFGLGQGEAIATALRNYKKGTNTAEHIKTLWEAWSTRFRITSSEMLRTDGALDAVVCATVAYLYHHHPDKLLRLRHQVPEKTGRGPFYVLAEERA
jgi:predicted nuclease with RNAse H fold